MTTEILGLGPYEKDGKMLRVKHNGENKIALLSHDTLTQLHGGLISIDEIPQSAVQLSDLDERTWKVWTDIRNDVRDANIDNVYQSFVRNGLVMNGVSFDETTRRIALMVLGYNQSRPKNEVGQGQDAYYGTYMTEIRNPLTLQGSEYSVLLQFFYQAAKVPWVRRKITTDMQLLLRRLMILVKKESDRALVRGINGAFHGLRPFNISSVPKYHGTEVVTAAQLGLTAGAWSGGNLAAIEPAIQAMLDYAEDNLLIDGDGSFILYLGTGLKKWTRRRYTEEGKPTTRIDASLLEIPEIREIVKNIHLEPNEAMLLNVNPEQTMVMEAVPFTIAQRQSGYVGEMTEVVPYESRTIKHISSSDFKKNAILLREDVGP